MYGASWHLADNRGDAAIRSLSERSGHHQAVCRTGFMSTRPSQTFAKRRSLHSHGVRDSSQNMAEIQVRRLPVVNRDKQLVGIVSLSDLAKKEANTAKALRGIARPSEQHNQAA